MTYELRETAYDPTIARMAWTGHVNMWNGWKPFTREWLSTEKPTTAVISRKYWAIMDQHNAAKRAGATLALNGFYTRYLNAGAAGIRTWDWLGHV